MFAEGRRRPRARRSGSADEAASWGVAVGAWTGEEAVAGVLVMGLTFLSEQLRIQDPIKSDKSQTQAPSVPDTLRP